MHNGTNSQVLVFVAAVAAVGLVALARGLIKQGPLGFGPLRPRAVMSRNEQGMYWRLVQTFPDAVVLAQVSFSALITARAARDRNRFNRKFADFVICDRAMNVLAVVELDDSSHRGREDNDAQCDALLQAAGYRVVRFPRTPDVDALRAAIRPPTTTAPPVAKSS